MGPRAVLEGEVVRICGEHLSHTEVGGSAMKQIIGLGLILLGAILIVFSVLAWLSLLTPAVPQLSGATAMDVLLEIVRKVPWVALVGLLLIYAGLRCLGVPLQGK